MLGLLLAVAHAGSAQCTVPEQQLEPVTRVSPRVWGHPRTFSEGHVVLNVTVDPNGTPITVDVVCSTVDDTLTHASVRAVHLWKFAPSAQSHAGRVVLKFTLRR